MADYAIWQIELTEECGDCGCLATYYAVTDSPADLPARVHDRVLQIHHVVLVGTCQHPREFTVPPDSIDGRLHDHTSVALVLR